MKHFDVLRPSRLQRAACASALPMLALATAAACLVPGPARAQGSATLRPDTLRPDETRAGNVIFRVPDGWTRVPQPAVQGAADRVVLMPNDLLTGQRCWIEILPGRPLQGEFAAAFDQLFQAVVPPGERQRIGEVGSATRRSGVPMRHRWIVHEPSLEPDPLCTLLIAWQTDGRVEAAVYTARNVDHFDHYAPAFTELVERRLRFANQVVLAKGEPKLTLWDVENVADLLAWLVNAPLSQAQRAELRELYVAGWQHDDPRAHEALRDTLDSRRQLDPLDPARREVARLAILQQELPKWRAQAKDDPFGAFTVRVHDAAHPPIAAGQPPLTRVTSDAALELLLFMLNEARGGGSGGGLAADASMRERWAAEMSRRWAAMPAGDRANMVQTPLQWATVRMAWPAVDEGQRQQLRAQWREQLAPLLAVLPQPIDGAADSSGTESSSSGGLSSSTFASMMTSMTNSTITQMSAISNMSGYRR